MDKMGVVKLLVERYGLSQNQRDILVVLLKGDTNAEIILKQTSISSGRIYRILGELESMGLIKKIAGKPAVYSMADFSQRVQDYVENSFKKHLDSQKEILEALVESDNKSSVDIVSGSKEEFDAEIIRMINDAKWMKVLHKHVSLPWFLYVYFEEGEFLKIRQEIARSRSVGSSSQKYNLLLKRQAYLNLYKNKPVEHLMLKKTYDDYLKMLCKVFGERKSLGMLEKFTARLQEQSNVKILLLDRLITPFSTYVSNNEVMQPLFLTQKQNRILRMRGKEVVEIYQDLLKKYTEDGNGIQLKS